MARKKTEATIYKEVAKDCIAGKYGNGSTRRHNVTKDGYEWWKVQEQIYKLQK